MLSKIAPPIKDTGTPKNQVNASYDEIFSPDASAIATAGALLGFMNAISSITSLCYFNYAYTGERVGRALIGLDFENDEELSIHRGKIFEQAGKTVRAVKEVLIDALF